MLISHIPAKGKVTLSLSLSPKKKLSVKEKLKRNSSKMIKPEKAKCEYQEKALPQKKEEGKKRKGTKKGASQPFNSRFRHTGQLRKDLNRWSFYDLIYRIY